jgi:hypothetical protein
VATLVLLLSLGALVAVTPSGSIRYPWYLRFANLAGWAASWFFVYRINFYTALLGVPDRAPFWQLGYPLNLYLAGLVTLVIVVVNCLLI